MEGSEKALGITIQPLLVKFQPHDVMDLATIKVKAIATQAESYDVLVGAIGDGCQATMPTRFIREAKGHLVEYAMAGTIGEVVLGECPTHSQFPPISPSSTKASSRKDHLVKVHQATPVW